MLALAVPAVDWAAVVDLGWLHLLAIVGASVLWQDGRRRQPRVAAAHRGADVDAQTIAELRAHNTMLESAASEWRTTVDTIDAPIIVAELSGRVRRMNHAAEAMLPGTLADWIGEPTTHLARHAPWADAIKLAGEAVHLDAVSTARVQDRQHGRTWDLWCRCIQGRKPPAVVMVARDVTDVVELEESLRRSQTMAALGSVAAGVAHEVRNPLFAISSLVDAWALRPPADPKPFFDAFRREVSRLRSLMNELLEYGRPVTPQLHVQALRAVIDTAVLACVPEADARRVRVAAPSSQDADILMDPSRLVRVFINLIENAIEHAPADSEVTLDVRASSSGDAGRIEVVVRDAGPGFAPEDLPNVFTPFFSRRPGGFGLGLAICERIVNEHHGKIVAGNAAVGGAVVTVDLPIADAGGARTALTPEP
jgi:signal transduction histidine kinase